MGVSNIELKTFDHTANMPLAFAAIIMCGMDGMKRSLKLPAPVDKDPSKLDDATKRANNIRLLAQSFTERKTFLLGTNDPNVQPADIGKPVRDLFGMKALENYLAVQQKDHELFSQMSFEEEVAAINEKY